MTRTDRFDDLAGAGADEVQAGLAERVRGEAQRLRHERLNLYAGANILTPALAAGFDPTLSLMPFMGPPHDKEQPGSDFAASLEVLTSRLACEVFEAAWGDCRLPSCTIANLAVFACFTAPGDTILAPAASDGGHLSQRRGGTPSLFGLDIVELPFDAARQCLDALATAALIRAHRPRLVMLGRSVMLGPDTLEPVVAAARETGALTVYDLSHVAGLAAGRVFPNPLRAGVDLLTMSTYKTLAGPTGAIVAGADRETGERFARFVDGALLANQDLARLPALAGVLAEFRDGGSYARRTIELATALKAALAAAGLPVLLPGVPAQSHQVVVPIGDLDATKAAMAALERGHLLVGRCPVPGTRGAHGLRFGSQLAARIGIAPDRLTDVAAAVAALLGAARAAGEAPAEDDAAVLACRCAVAAALASAPPG
ncbi:beta-eliminating lyase-related protein [Aurantimonas sp. HBX-1]|uniref:beta-eliminating lyase-related protein n=1 Tax=Aurantimonas sp. HBX-1 TaxID=2906072 RepID=UPI001F191392|nr:beta-eliminating lyase-related protein [Aurantimonas sp. HBX-1]UIJ70460.1 beta-eliminating lyase-related protein [Aurantimonas sp. HBX-1]